MVRGSRPLSRSPIRAWSFKPLKIAKTTKQNNLSLATVAQNHLSNGHIATSISERDFVTLLPQANPSDVFANGEIRSSFFRSISLIHRCSFDNVDVFGFDYDYTRASYTDKVQEFIHTKALQWMIEHLKSDLNLHFFVPSQMTCSILRNSKRPANLIQSLPLEYIL